MCVRRIADWEHRGMCCSTGKQSCICAGFNMRWLRASVPWRTIKVVVLWKWAPRHVGAIRLQVLGGAV
jgi:hypothetical protein